MIPTRHRLFRGPWAIALLIALMNIHRLFLIREPSASEWPTDDANDYSTGFQLTEKPISENGNWISGKTTGLDWTNVQTTSGIDLWHRVGFRWLR
jgi:hypothetical protein